MVPYGGLVYLGEDPNIYKRSFEMKGPDNPKAWSDLIHLCKVLNETAPNKLEAALAPILDVDEALKFLALDNALLRLSAGARPMQSSRRTLRRRGFHTIAELREVPAGRVVRVAGWSISRHNVHQLPNAWGFWCWRTRQVGYRWHCHQGWRRSCTASSARLGLSR